MHDMKIPTPIGTMLAKANDSGIYSQDIVERADATATSGNPILLKLKVELEEYFSGSRREFSVPLTPVGTPFQMSVWQTLRQIPYGETISYVREAAMLGRASAVRAVANANGRNPISILIPCHRVIASGGGIGGYNGGVWRKEFLLKLETKYH